MRRIDEVIKSKEITYVENTVNDNDIKENNVVNDSVNNVSKKNYGLDKTKFTPNTDETIYAEEIATFLDDLENYAFYLSVVNNLGLYTAQRLLRVVQVDIEEKAKTKTPVRNPAKYFAWKYKKRLF